MLGTARKLALCAALAATPVAVNANNFAYNNLDFSIGTTPGSLGVNFNTQFTDNTHFIVAGESKFDGDWILTGGVGFNGPVNQFADLYGHMVLKNVKEGSDDLVGEDFLPEFAVGTRVWFMQNMELYGNVGQLIDGDNAITTYETGFRFHSTQQLVMGASLRKTGIYDSQVMMNVRFQY